MRWPKVGQLTLPILTAAIFESQKRSLLRCPQPPVLVGSMQVTATDSDELGQPTSIIDILAFKPLTSRERRWP